MSFRRPSRRDLLRGTAATGLFIAGSRLPALAQDNKDQPLPQGAAGKLTVIHRTEYFEQAQNLFRETVANFATANNAELEISTTNPESFGDFLGKMTAAVKAGNPPDIAYTSNVSISQMQLLDLVEDVSDVVDEAVSKYGALMAGINAEKFGKLNGKWASIPFLGQHHRPLLPRRQAEGEGHRSGDARYLRQASGCGARHLRSRQQDVGLGPDAEPERRRLRLPDQPRAGVRRALHRRSRHEGHVQLARNRGGLRMAEGNLRPQRQIWAMPCLRASKAGAIPRTTRRSSRATSATRTTPSASTPRRSATTIRSSRTSCCCTAPKANNGDSRDGGHVGGWLTIFKGAPNVDLAKKLALHLLDPANFTKMSSVAGGLFMPAYENLWTDELLATDPNFEIIKSQVGVANPFLGPSWPANPNAAIDAIRAQGVLEQSVGNMIAGRMAPADAVKDAHDKIVQIFEEGGIAQ